MSDLTPAQQYLARVKAEHDAAEAASQAAQEAAQQELAHRAVEAERRAAAAAREMGLFVDEAPPERRLNPTPTELIELYGGAENYSRYASDPNMPLNGVKVITQAEYDERRAAHSTPGVAWREAPDHVVPPDPARRAHSKIIAEWLADGSTWA